MNFSISPKLGSYRDETLESSNLWLSKRFLISVLMFLGYCCMELLTSNISIAVVEMTSNRTEIEGNSTIYHVNNNFDKLFNFIEYI